mmetsp:Transcript_22974/g.32371  ORF Transcript_22974/g.32371 Transcript_22974/m.32371 type:complete len:402 (-) Transcript_22974:441-1646(-)|eukprot:CAMPEP_0184867210 /NCGR_PEP_ID=MMETSP0580-20130426/25436_1 /TAXON_ID=1118495 /ORGANISM="Dactyliosolen fragilissimus" /LENGTH=401 /DNA_ID=CAMNT_0027367327 /DNA_START=8 /DNA_END=1213 /DNA_ORIENTATION=+
MKDRIPRITEDGRFRAGRKLVCSGKANLGAVDMFATLVEGCRHAYGKSSIETAAVYYEYGNALFRASSIETSKEDKVSTNTTNTTTSANEGTISASLTNGEIKKEGKGKEESCLAPKVLGEKDIKETFKDDTVSTSNDLPKKDETQDTGDQSDDDNDDEDDFHLALELMENAWSIMDQYVETNSTSSSMSSTTKNKVNQKDESDDQKDESENDGRYLEWTKEQIPRVLIGIGDVLSTIDGRKGDAFDAYLRSLPHRERMLQEELEHDEKDKVNIASIAVLKKRRELVEALVLLAECLLDFPNGKDVIATEIGKVLVKANERIEYARGYYDKARDELQEAVYLMGILAGSQDIASEKENICFIATMLMGVGTTLAESDESNNHLESDNTDGKSFACKKQKLN